MKLFKCKMCGGDLEIKPGESVAVCQYCGTKQTLPKLDDEKRANLYDRANHFRRNNEFDKAMGIYENILNENITDAEAYWSLVLCHYGIEYVEDSSTHKRVPTVNRAQFTSIYDDEDYKSAIKNADETQKQIYEDEAKAINEIQKGILEISQKEEPFDVFICYKETDNNGRRTQDSVLANDLYYQLTQEGFKVFFSRITLEDKLGTAYEPYIFAALNSAKVMVVLGTKSEYFNAVWVKNEWSRYLALIKNGKNKILIPAYRDMDPYDLPEEFSHLQAQDMSKLGFMQDLIRGIKKITSSNDDLKVKETVVINNSNNDITPLLDRAFMALEDSEFEKADSFCEQVLNLDAKNAMAYLGKFMAELQVKKQEELKNQDNPFDNNNNYQKAIRFADNNLKSELIQYIEYINTRNENNRLEGLYTQAVEIMNSAKTQADYKNAEDCFSIIIDYKDSENQIAFCKQKIEKLKAKKDKLKKRIKKIAIILTPIISLCIVFLIVFTTIIIPKIKYNEAMIKYNEDMELYNNGKYHEAIAQYMSLNRYKTNTKIEDKWKQYNASLISAGQYQTVGIKSDGTVFAVGGNDYGQCNISNWKDIVSISVNNSHTVGLKSNGTVVAVGDNTEGQCYVSDWKDIVSISVGPYFTVGLKSNGTVVAVGDNTKGECNVSNWKDIISISTGLEHTVGLKSDGTVVAIGYNKCGQCNVTNWKDIKQPKK